MSNEENMFQSLRQALDASPPVEGMNLAEAILLPDPLNAVVSHIIRRASVTLAELAAELNLPINETRELGELLVEKGFFTMRPSEPEGDPTYSVRFANKRKRRMPSQVWDKLNDWKMVDER